MAAWDEWLTDREINHLSREALQLVALRADVHLLGAEKGTTVKLADMIVPLERVGAKAAAESNAGPDDQSAVMGWVEDVWERQRNRPAHPGLQKRERPKDKPPLAPVMSTRMRKRMEELEREAKERGLPPPTLADVVRPVATGG